jgi:2-oxoglutarate dehydrogenase E2 component (dihydrolipoamide succinyltransferase)
MSVPFHRESGEHITDYRSVRSLPSPQIDVSVNAPAAGKITELLVNEEDTVTVGQDLFRFAPGEGGESSAAAPSEAAPQAEKADAAEPKAAQQESPPPPVAQERPKAGVKETSKPAPKEEGKKSTPSTPVASAGATGGFSRNETRVKMSRMRLRIAERLKESQNTAAFLTTFNEIDMSSLMEMRKRYKDDVLKQHEIKLGFMSAFTRACTLALKEIPAANASIEVRVPCYFAVSPPEGACDLNLMCCPG